MSNDAEKVVFPGVTCLRETPSGKAIVVRLETGEEWVIPKSLVHDDSEVWQPGHEGDLVVPEWFAIKESKV